MRSVRAIGRPQVTWIKGTHQEGCLYGGARSGLMWSGHGWGHFTTGWEDPLPLFKLSKDHSAWEAFTADTDTLKYTVTLELVEHQASIKQT